MGEQTFAGFSKGQRVMVRGADQRFTLDKIYLRGDAAVIADVSRYSGVDGWGAACFDRRTVLLGQLEAA